ncbi:histidine kinase/DNA gyrase B/HSP90-like ATPase [Methanohalophilus euhalobius]|uniref:Histidine kinase-, DNA gyrase B-, and HSP90-like ATPase n=1 Tax=Methanohalophilus euhalobius TaxID=51203 RepID=A0A285F6S6_9EURY|nr:MULTISPECIES: ATP-binding protein [Methanohalophilus]ODV49938.1 MAG: hypothetical protein A8273_597 [Methanohalophilus sp. 2-GBenrich]RXG34882.1 hypothetical protein CI957_476 [Methanohalophilus sp. WG1-DM]TCL12365.1 histidine kinase/DNA gyrase B/HSP90-like ATPase [Methanohalophilus euhalobius]SNY06096.1 Histidine kinase-, DNA gyrase B-, and HSP90-like ATPase [Methanohalophilus euhalobius]
MKFDENKIGPHLINIITSGLYDGNLNCVREYVQNSVDAKAKNINVSFENGMNLVIEDDGTGMDLNELENALNVGISNKNEFNVGWRGIGIWSGVSVCEKIVIITKKKNSGKYRIEIDNNKIRKEINNTNSILKILENSTTDISKLSLGRDDSYLDGQFTIIRLERILRPQKDIFESENIKEYLQKVTPASFNPNEFTLGSKIENYLQQKGVAFPKVNIKLEDETIYRPPYTTEPFFEKVITKDFIVGDKLVAVGWILSSQANKGLKSPNKGIFFKKKGFTIGNENLVKNLYEGSYNEWQFGEIHVISNEIVENAARNQFELNSGLVDKLYEQVSEFIGSLDSLNRYQSSKVPSSNISNAQKYLNEGNIKSAEHEINKAHEKVTRVKNYPKDPDLGPLKKNIEKKIQTDTDTLKQLKEQIQKSKASPSKNKIKKDRLNATIDSLPDDIKKSIKRANSKGRLIPEISITDPIREMLAERVGHDDEIKELTQEAYGWKDVRINKGNRILTLGDKGNDARDARLGLLIYTFHDIIVNPTKHEKKGFEWFNSCSEEEKLDVMNEIYSTLGLMHRLIKNSKEFKSKKDHKK